MHDGWKIIIGLLIFAGLITFPVLYSGGKVAPIPDPKIDTPEIQKLAEKKCIEPKSFMKTEHMKLLSDWRDSVVREGKTIYVATDGKNYTMSLQKTCMNCHSSKKKFCDQCHNYSAVVPYCWDCHIVPKEEEKV